MNEYVVVVKWAANEDVIVGISRGYGLTIYIYIYIFRYTHTHIYIYIYIHIYILSKEV